MEISSVKKKFKSRGFAAGCDRETISRGAEALNWTLDELIGKTLEAMRAAEDDIREALRREGVEPLSSSV